MSVLHGSPHNPIVGTPYEHFTDAAHRAGELGGLGLVTAPIHHMPGLLTHICCHFLDILPLPYVSKTVNLRSTLTNSQGPRVKEKERCLSVEEALQPFRGEGVFPKSRNSPWSGLWLCWGSASSFWRGCWDEGRWPTAAGDVGGSLSFQCCLLSIHMAPGALFQTCLLAQKGAGPSFTEIRSTYTWPKPQKWWRDAGWFKPGPPTLRSWCGGGGLFCLLENQVL